MRFIASCYLLYFPDTALHLTSADSILPVLEVIIVAEKRVLLIKGNHLLV